MTCQLVSGGASRFLLFPLTFYVAPSAPQSFTVVSVTSTAITLSWQPPEKPNGVVTAYFVWYTETLTCNSSQVSSSSRVELPRTADTHTFTGLEEDTPYVFYVSAETSAGEGETAMVMGRTSEDGESDKLLQAYILCGHITFLVTVSM